MLKVAIGLLLLCVPTLAIAQTPDSYRVNYYVQGAAQPLPQSDTFPAAAAICNQAPIAGGSTVNPTTVSWADPQNTGRACVYVVPPTGNLLSLPAGSYEGTVTAINSAGQAESTRAPFSRLGAPPARTGLKFIRP